MSFLFIRNIVHKFRFFFLTILVVIAGTYFYYRGFAPEPATVHYKTVAEAKDIYVRFDMEAYDKIAGQYWQKATEADLSALFQLSLQKAGNLPSLPTLITKDRSGTATMLEDAFKTATSTLAEKNLARDILIVALYNLAPIGRNGLLSDKQEVALRQQVANVNPNNDLYGDLGLQKGASINEVDTAFKQKQTQLAKATTTEAKAELQKVTYAHNVLTNADDKTRYDTAKVEPTVFEHRLGKTLYLYISQISPTTLQEFAQTVDTASTTPGLDSMIIDLRGNVGGALDFAPAFLGLFIGQNQYAFDFFFQGDYLPQRTSVGKFDVMSRYKDVAILTDNMTQSTSEVLTAMFKRFHMAKIVGGTTRGWGSVENTVPVETVIDPTEKYSILLVKYLTLRDDGQPIEGKGVDPDINTSDKDWTSQVRKSFSSTSLVDALLKQATKPQLK